MLHEAFLRRPYLRILLYIVVYKAFSMVAIACVILFFRCDDPLDRIGSSNTNILLAELTKENSSQYIRISQAGYENSESIKAFFPLWPRLISLTPSFGLLSAEAEALVLANILSTVGLLLVWKFFCCLAPRPVADTGLILLCVSPGAFFLCLPYSESLGIVLAAGLLYGLATGNRSLTWASSLLLPMVRPPGVIGAFGVGAGWALKQRSWSGMVPLVLSIAGFSIYLIVMLLETGEAFAGFRAQQLYTNRPAIGNVWRPFDFLMSFVAVSGLHSVTGSLIDRLLFVGCILMLPVLWRMHRLSFWWTLPVVIVPAMTNHFLSFTRFALFAFPVFLALASVISRLAIRHLLATILMVNALLQAYVTLYFFECR